MGPMGPSFSHSPSDPPGEIGRRLDAVRESIARACGRADRDPRSVRLIAVSKTRPAAQVAAALAAGQRDFGENTVQDALPKIEALAASAPVWHFVGHLQKNKAKFLPGRFQWLHSLDDAELARRLGRALEAAGARLQVLVQVNLSGAPQQHGLEPEVVIPFLEGLLDAPPPGLVLRGLMALGPRGAGEAELRRAFARLRRLAADCRQHLALADFDQLSMGMSNDYPAAIAEGATLVRIGSAIFGSRDK